MAVFKDKFLIIYYSNKNLYTEGIKFKMHFRILHALGIHNYVKREVFVITEVREQHCY